MRTASFVVLLCGVAGCARHAEAVASGPERAPGIAFEENLGQLPGDVRYAARGAGFTLWLTDDRAVLALRGGHGAADVLELSTPRMARPTARRSLPGRASYLRGADARRWIAGVPRFEEVAYPVRPGVELVFHGEEGRFEYDFVVDPGASADGLELRLSGARDLRLDAAGALVVSLGHAALRQEPPVAYDVAPDGTRTAVASAARLLPDERLAFEVEGHDPARRLVVDPVLLYATYLGGSGFDQARAVAVDGAGNVYVTGLTSSLDFPEQGALEAFAGATDAFVAKLSPDGQALVYATYLGGSAEDASYAIALDASGSAFVAGTTASLDYPVTGQAYQPTLEGASNAFVSKLTPDGSGLVYSTLFGGSGYDAAQGLALAPSGAAFVAGFTQSPDLPTQDGFQQTLLGAENAFVAALSADGAKLLGATYLGGSASDSAAAVALDAAGNVYLAGYAQSADLPVKGALQGALTGSQNVFLAELGAALDTLTLATYLGGSGADEATALAIDPSGALYVAGGTTSLDFPVKGAFQAQKSEGEDAFVAKLAPGAASIAYSTFLGGRGVDVAAGLAIDGPGAAYVVGATRSTDFPTLGPFQGDNRAPSSPDGNAFLAILDPGGGRLVGASYLGGSGGATAQGVALGGGGAWMVGSAGTGLPAPNALFPSYAAQIPNGQNAFLAELSPDAGVALDAGRGVDTGAEASPVDDAQSPGVTVVPPTPIPTGGTVSSCDCRTEPRDGDPVGALAALAVAATLVARRRRT